MDGMEPIAQASASELKMSLVTPIRAAIRIRRKIRNLKKSHQQLDLSGRNSAEGSRSSLLRRQFSTDSRVGYHSPKFFNFDTPSLDQVALSNLKRKKKRKKSRPVLYPGNGRKYLPVEHKSKAKRCLILFFGIVCFQILNAIENLDDNVLKYELDGLEKTMQREVFGQKIAIDKITDLLKDYLATHWHNKPLVISMNGPSGVGKSHMGRILAKHFRSVAESDDFVLQYYVMHNCPSDSNIGTCETDLSKMISDMVTRAELEEKIPIFIFDEMELMPPSLLDMLHGYFQLNQDNEYLNAIYILISNIGGNEVTKYYLQNVSSDVLNVPQELHDIIQSSLRQHHNLWDVAEIVPFILLEKSHIANCFLDELLREGFYPDNSNIENLAGQLKYYTIRDKQYSITGCKQVVSKVNHLHPYT
ncbi:torsin-4A [Hyla sarda]|uniref:torsin-4A n=1 Tax=Hyla sarda TaxID=327740 RepID=UPI0024C3CAD5|nr:torsin-4A [Hyla sarda]XP_056397106.1 torsin-4A [Hyla sarda]XP_056397107.1 torsin-4A [Hyla sarda]XP_056397108.1 torsin-4A [Hyla sarda]XP_056397109.1 torsin-4A [Hyla sarda]XP_056397110.1 torsin-4A [Hyla sarda]